VTLDSKQLSNFGTDVDVIVSVPAGAERVIGFLEPSRFSSDLGIANISYSAITSVTVAIISY
jgi:hypothetical protein